MDRGWSVFVSLALVCAVLYPLQTDPQRDSFPLSTYPMFTNQNPPGVAIDHVVGVGDGHSQAIPPGLVAGGEVLQAKAAITAQLTRGRPGAVALCRDVAQRVARDEDFAWVQQLEVRSDSYQVLGYFSSTRRPLKSNVHARCKVER
jgi:hypothetical protein